MSGGSGKREKGRNRSTRKIDTWFLVCVFLYYFSPNVYRFEMIWQWQQKPTFGKWFEAFAARFCFFALLRQTAANIIMYWENEDTCFALFALCASQCSQHLFCRCDLHVSLMTLGSHTPGFHLLIAKIEMHCQNDGMYIALHKKEKRIQHCTKDDGSIENAFFVFAHRTRMKPCECERKRFHEFPRTAKIDENTNYECITKKSHGFICFIQSDDRIVTLGTSFT